MKPSLPTLHIFNRQKEVRVPLPRLQKQLESALSFLPKTKSALPPQIEISLISKKAMQKAHADFFHDPSPTDVITFPYGEILICPQVAKAQGALYKRTTADEILLYGIHGLLHLKGWTDTNKKGFEQMKKLQEKIFKKVRQD
jgi:probable rRNA maturation factor